MMALVSFGDLCDLIVPSIQQESTVTSVATVGRILHKLMAGSKTWRTRVAVHHAVRVRAVSSLIAETGCFASVEFQYAGHGRTSGPTYLYNFSCSMVRTVAIPV